MPLVTIDFHNTLFRCDDWFRLEIESLPVAVLDALQSDLGDHDIGQLKERAAESYRDIRRRAMATGVECDADTSIITVLEKLGVRVSEERVGQIVADVMTSALESAHPRTGAVDLVQQVHRCGIPLAVVSSAAYHPFLEWSLAKYQLANMFSHVVTSAACGVYKSDPQIYRYTLDLFEVSSESAVHIGDSHRFDVVSASSVGMRTILLTDDPNVQLDPAPDATITCLSEAKPHLDRLLGV